MTIYRLHNLLDVFVDQRVPNELADAIAFQLHHFQTTQQTPRASKRIEVYPYEDWRSKRSVDWRQFHGCEADEGRWLDDPTTRTAYVRDECGFVVYADTPAMLINLLIQLILVEQEMTLIHAAAVMNADGEVTLLPGPGGVGKTALLGELVMHHGYKLLGDDIVMLDQAGQCWSFPRSFVLKSYHEAVYPQLFAKLKIDSASRREAHRPSIKRRLGNLAADNVPFKGALRWLLRRAGRLESVQQALIGPRRTPYLATVAVDEVFGPGCVAKSGPVRRVIFLERGSQPQFSRETMSLQGVCRRAMAILHHEWADHMRHFWSLGSVEIVSLSEYFSQTSHVLRNALARCPYERLVIPLDALPCELTEVFLNQPKPTQQPHRAAA